MAKPAPTIPCQYKTGKTLGSGTYAVVKEAVHTKTGKYYACKVISKKLMEGREYMVRNEIAVLKKVSQGHANIVTLHDYFETANNLYLVFDLCTGGELFDRICAKGSYFEEDAASIVRTVLGAVKYIHDAGIVHRDLKPENLLFRTKAEDAELLIADFGLSRVVEEDKHVALTEVCGTPGYMAPEIFKKVGHGKPVDIWAIGVIAYFLLCGYTPFDRENPQDEMAAICRGDYKFEPEQYWVGVSETARDFVRQCLTIDQQARPTAEQALAHAWLSSDTPHFVPDPTSAEGAPTNLLPGIRKNFDARKTFRKAVFSMMAVRRLSLSPVQHTSQLARDVEKYREGAEQENTHEDSELVFHHNQGQPPTPSSSSSDTETRRRSQSPPPPPVPQRPSALPGSSTASMWGSNSGSGSGSGSVSIPASVPLPGTPVAQKQNPPLAAAGSAALAIASSIGIAQPQSQPGGGGPNVEKEPEIKPPVVSGGASSPSPGAMSSGAVSTTPGGGKKEGHGHRFADVGSAWLGALLGNKDKGSGSKP